MSNELRPVIGGLENSNAEKIETPITHELPSSLIRDRAETLLRPIIKYWIVELMDCGGTNPAATCEYISEEEPELYDVLGTERVMEVCRELHRSEDPAQSEWCATRLYQFNKTYFDGQLGDYRVHVVYDVDFWVSEPSKKLEPSHIDHAKRQIILPVTHCDGGAAMDALLLHYMAHAATRTTTDGEGEWLAEMERLSRLGAPVFKEDLEDGK